MTVPLVGHPVVLATSSTPALGLDQVAIAEISPPLEPLATVVAATLNAAMLVDVLTSTTWLFGAYTIGGHRNSPEMNGVCQFAVSADSAVRTWPAPGVPET